MEGTLAKAFTRARRRQRRLHRAVDAALAEITASEELSSSYVSRIARLCVACT
jgi:ribosomal protein L32